MLRIKEGKLEKLKDFGFKPKYDEDTGKLNRYIKIFETENNRFYFTVDATETWIDQCDFFKPERLNPFYKQLKIDYCFCNSGKDAKLLEFIISELYDLIKADMVERI